MTFLPVGLATLQERAPAGEEWVHEEKLDGYRIEAVVQPHALHLFSRNRKDWTTRFPAVVDALRALPVHSLVLDGEIVAHDSEGNTSFQHLQQSLENHALRNVRYHVFDVLAIDGADLRQLPLAFRRAFLRDLLALVPRGARTIIRPTRQFDPSDGDPLAQACALGIEGVVSKRDDSPYPTGRSPLWIKSKCARRQEFVVVGYTDPQGSRNGFGALLLGVYEGKALRYAGKVGTGFDVMTLQTIKKHLRTIGIPAHGMLNRTGVPRTGVHWVEPSLVAEIVFTEWTEDGLLRHPVFKGLRTDKSARDVRRED